MKNSIIGAALALICALFAPAAQAQTVTYSPVIVAGDDIAVSLSGLGNADTAGYGANKAPVQATLTGPDTATYFVRIKGAKKNLTWNVIVDETGSGTLAGTVKVQAVTNYIGSRANWHTLDFLKYKDLHSDTIVDGDQEFRYVATSSGDMYYRVQIINSAATTICKVYVTLTARN